MRQDVDPGPQDQNPFLELCHENQHQKLQYNVVTRQSKLKSAFRNLVANTCCFVKMK